MQENTVSESKASALIGFVVALAGSHPAGSEHVLSSSATRE
jgi:hypothetical protein